MRNLVVCLLFAAGLRAAPLLDEGYREMYSLQFDLAHHTFATYEQQNPADRWGLYRTRPLNA
jgi:hypothetical protein